MMNINKSFINDLRFDGAEKTYFDDSLKGFGVRVRKDSASYIVMYRNAYGKQKKLTIAKTTQITPAQAREEAKQRKSHLRKRAKKQNKFLLLSFKGKILKTTESKKEGL